MIRTLLAAIFVLGTVLSLNWLAQQGVWYYVQVMTFVVGG